MPGKPPSTTESEEHGLAHIDNSQPNRRVFPPNVARRPLKRLPRRAQHLVAHPACAVPSFVPKEYPMLSNDALADEPRALESLSHQFSALEAVIDSVGYYRNLVVKEIQRDIASRQNEWSQRVLALAAVTIGVPSVHEKMVTQLIHFTEEEQAELARRSDTLDKLERQWARTIGMLNDHKQCLKTNIEISLDLDITQRRARHTVVELERVKRDAQEREKRDKAALEAMESEIAQEREVREMREASLKLAHVQIAEADLNLKQMEERHTDAEKRSRERERNLNERIKELEKQGPVEESRRKVAEGLLADARKQLQQQTNRRKKEEQATRKRDEQEKARLREEIAQCRRLAQVREEHSAWELYEATWTMINGAPLSFSILRWPTLNQPKSPADITKDAVHKLLFSTTHSHGVSDRDRVKEALLRWHTDKFGPVLMRVGDADKGLVREASDAVVRILTELRTEMR